MLFLDRNKIALRLNIFKICPNLKSRVWRKATEVLTFIFMRPCICPDVFFIISFDPSANTILAIKLLIVLKVRLRKTFFILTSKKP